MVKWTERLWRLLNHKLFVLLVLLFMVAVYGTKSDRYYGWTNPKVQKGEPIISDGAGYYAYLPQWFIYDTDNFEFFDSITKKYPQSRFSDNVWQPNIPYTQVNKYYTGTALALSPFFAVAHVYAKNAGYDSDGYSKPYRVLINFGCIAYFLLGCIGCYLFLRAFALQRFWVLVTVLCMAFGTNLSFYTNVYAPYSHVFSFGVIAWLLYVSKKWADKHTFGHFVLLCTLIGFAAIIRPTNMIVLVFVPFLFPATRAFVERLKLLLRTHFLHLLTGLLSIGCFIGFQLWSTHAQTGHWALNTYTTEKFDFWLEPKVLEVLFSWRKGLFIFAPVTLLIIPGWIVLFRNKRRLFWGSVLFFALFTYVTASWWCWWYGGGLGMRPFVDVFPLLFLPLAFLLNSVRNWLRIVVLALAFVGCKMYQVYEFQMKSQILHYDDMNYEQFRHVFMETGLRYAWSLHLTYEHLPVEQPKKEQSVTMLSSGQPLKAAMHRFKGDDLLDNPQATIRSLPADSALLFGARLTGEAWLYTEDTNPSLHVQYFKNAAVVRNTEFFFGHLLPETEQPEPFALEIYPQLRYGEFDSVVIRVNEGNTFTAFKNLRLKQFYF